MKAEYPKALYHATEAPCLVADPVAHDAKGAGWFESPADAIEDAATAPAPVKAKGDKAGK